MSEIFQDSAGNKYLGDCKWGNHDINYPTTNWLKSLDSSVSPYSTLFLDDMVALLSGAGWTSVSRTSNWSALGTNQYVFSGTMSGGGTAGLKTQNYVFSSAGSIGLAAYNNLISGSEYPGIGTGTQFYSFYYLAYATSTSYACVMYSPNANKSGYQSTCQFDLVCRLVDVNTNFNYYSASVNNHTIVISTLSSLSQTSSGSFVPLSTSPAMPRAEHYIANAEKTLLQSGRAAYTISCSDGQTPTSQWATDMWVYDNNATLGYPVIGRVPNMLLGTGSYTYLKPVKINGSVFPDGGSPWYLPVGTFSGKTLLMRCYSSLP